MSSPLRTIKLYNASFGLPGVLKFLYAKLSGGHPLFSKRMDGFKHPVYVRMATTDPAVYRQVLVQQHYDWALPKPPKIIIDAGANIGLSAVFFANRYPDATIYALEPAEDNFRMLQKNTADYPNVVPMKAALWKEDGVISLVDPGLGDHGFQTTDGNSANASSLGRVKARTIGTLMKENGIDHVDLLKIDIEGSEKEVFETSQDWIEKVDVIMAELHDNLKPGCESAFNNATKDFGQAFTKGETIIRIRKKAVQFA